MKKMVFIAAALLATASAFAQTSKQVISTANVDLLAPIGKVVKNTHTAGVAAGLQIEVRSTKRISYTASSGYSVLVAKPDYKTIIQFPTMIGIKYRLGDVISIQTMGGIAVSNNGLGSNFTYSPSIRFNYGTFAVNAKYTTTIITGKDNDISTVGLGLSYRL